MEVLLNLYSNENKPQGTTPLDLALVTYLVCRRAFDHEIHDSQHTLSIRLSADYKAVKRSLERLDELHWITYRNRGDGLPKGIALNLQNLPAAQPIRDKITPDAERLVDFYLELRKSVNKRAPVIRGGKLIEPRLKLPRNWKQRQLASAQRLVTRYQGYPVASRVVYELFHHPQMGIQTKARKSLYNLFNVIPRVRKIQEQVRSMATLQEVAKATEVTWAAPVGGEMNERRMTE